MNMKELNYGVEIETIKRTRESTAKAIQSVVGGNVQYVGGPYDSYEVIALDGRKWKVVADSSLSEVPSHLRAEIVTPILHWDDLETLQQVVRAIRRNGNKVSGQCGMHIHVGTEAFTPKSIANFAKIFYKQEPLILQAFGVNRERLQHYTKPLSDEFIQRLEAKRPRTEHDLNEAWYGRYNARPEHYDRSRYATINIHSIFYRKTLELRFFESSLHGGEIRTAVVFSLALAAKAFNSKAASSHKREYSEASAKYDFRVFAILRLGLIGDEFKAVRQHLLKRLPGSAAWKNGRPATNAANTANA